MEPEKGQSTAASLGIGEHVLVHWRLEGVIRFASQLDGTDFVTYGIELKKPLGVSSGELKGTKFFTTKPNHALFARASTVSRFDIKVFCVIKIQCMLRARMARRLVRQRINSFSWNMLDNNNEQMCNDRSKMITTDLPPMSSHRAQFKKMARLALLASRSIKTGPVGSVGENSCYDMIELDSSYSGLRLKFPLTLEQVLEMMEFFKRGDILHYNYISKILYEIFKMYNPQPNVQEITVPETARFTIVGDLHGQMEVLLSSSPPSQDLFTIFSLNGLPSPTNQYLFNGDFVDRGLCGVEICMVIFALKLLYPSCVYHNRGNHESRSQNTFMGFEEEVLEKYDGSPDRDPTRGRRVLTIFQTTFDVLPLAALIQEKIFVSHGGISGPTTLVLSQINAVDRKREPPIDLPGVENQIYEALLWSDPRPSCNFPEAFTGCRQSDRGAGVEYGADITNNFCCKNRVALCVRSHECVQEGFEVVHGGRVITIFSASCYCGMMTNKGAFLSFGSNLQPEIQQFFAQSLVQSSFTQKIMDMKQQKLEDNTIQMIRERILDEKANLYWYFNQADMKKTGKITRLEWSNGMKAVLKLDLPFFGFCSRLAEVKDNLIDYNKFLNRYKIQMRVQDTTWQSSIVDKVCRKLFTVCSDVKGAFDAFDTNKDGLIDYNEFYALLTSLDVGLSNDQIYELMRAFDTDNSNTICYQEFAQRIQMSYELLKGNLKKLQESLQNPELSRQMSTIGRALVLKYGEIQAAYAILCTEDGFIPRAAFFSIVKELKVSLDETKLNTLWDGICASSSEMSFSEFISAFHVKSDATDWGSTLIQQIANVLYQNRIQLKGAFRLFDLNNDGKISKEEFFKAVTNMNLQLDSPITMEQVNQIMNALDKDGNGTLDYREFFDGFKVVDMQHKKPE